MSAGWWGYELRRIGPVGLALPGIVALGVALIAALMVLEGAQTREVARALTAGLELGLPLAAGLVAAQVAGDEPALDLQLSVRTRYATTLGRRLALLLGWAALAALLWASSLRVAGLWTVPGSFLAGQLSWLSPLLWFVAAGAVLALAARGRTASSAVLGGLWVFENTPFGSEQFLSRPWLRPFFLFATTHTPGEAYWLGNRIALLGMAVLLGLCVPLLLGGEAFASGGEA